MNGNRLLRGSRRAALPIAFLLAIVSSVFLASGCQESRPAHDLLLPGQADVTGDPSFWAEEIGASGGTVTGANAVFDVPSGALASSVTITMDYDPGAPDEVELGPTGQTFSVACALTLDKPTGYDPADTYVVRRWNPTSSTWSTLTSSDNGSTVSASVLHFCRFRIEKVS